MGAADPDLHTDERAVLPYRVRHRWHQAPALYG